MYSTKISPYRTSVQQTPTNRERDKEQIQQFIIIRSEDTTIL
jgi:hypothetical protein